MKILVTQRFSKDKYSQQIDYLENNYINFFNKYKFTPVLLPNSSKDIIKYLLILYSVIFYFIKWFNYCNNIRFLGVFLWL